MNLMLLYLVLATGPGNLPAVQFLPSGSARFSSRLGEKPDRLCLGWVGARTGHKPGGLWPGMNHTAIRFYSSFHFVSTLAPSEYLSSDRIVTWSIFKLCSFMRSFTSHLQICYPTNIRWIAVKSGEIWREHRGLSIATQRILFRSQIWKRKGKERIKLHNLRIAHVTIRSELRYLILANHVMLKWLVFGGKTGPIATVRVLVWYDPLQRYGSGPEPDPELTRRFGTVANTRYIQYTQRRAESKSIWFSNDSKNSISLL